MAFAAGLAGQLSQGLEGFEVVGAAVGVAGVVDSIYAQHQLLGAAGLSQAQRQGDEHGVASRHVGARDHARLNPGARHGDGGVGEGGATPGGQVDGDGVVFSQSQERGQFGGGLQFAAMALAVIQRQPDHPITGFDRQGRGGG